MNSDQGGSNADESAVELAARMRRLERLAWILDNSLRVPGTKWRIGLDGFIGLIPGVGDITGSAVSGYILLQAVKLGVSWPVVSRMAGNIMLEGIVGVVPIFGDLFDFAFKANQRNVELMRAYGMEPKRVNRRSVVVLGIAVLLMVAFVVLLIWAAVAILKLLIGAIS